jgi:DNA polymerase V
MIGLVDCNNFYVSCERVFRPDLLTTPVVVLSNNDGCAISRSLEAKALGIKMGEPYFKFKDLVQTQGVHIFSSNFSLYGDMSKRVMDIIKGMAPKTEVYSVDESFIDATGIQDLETFGPTLRARILQWTGIPTCIGFGPTKTLAKVANHRAKKNPATGGIYILKNPDEVLESMAVQDIWGIGRRLGERLNKIGILSALDLKKANPEKIRNLFSTLVEQTVLELNGIRCFPITPRPQLRQSIQVSRSFKTEITSYSDLSTRICSFALRAAEKLRSEGTKCRRVTVWIRTNPFSQTGFYGNSIEYLFPQDVSDIQSILKGARECLKTLYRPGYGYKKASVTLSAISNGEQIQKGLFDQDLRKMDKLSRTMDILNSRFGKGTVQTASCGSLENIGNRQFRSPAYTTKWEEVRQV